jgi:signal recognition particle GTPase
MSGQCSACDGKGWLLADNDEHGLRIEKCDSCLRFQSDEEAVTFVAVKAATGSETDAVIASTAWRK